MSDPTRYRVANNQAQLTLGGNILAVDPFGPLVDYIDYARLKAEIDNFNEYLKWHADGHKFAAWQVWRSQQSDGGTAKGVQ
jgi:hypothetical protein